MSVSLCLFVCLSVCLRVGMSVEVNISGTTHPNCTKFSVHVACARSSVLFWRRWSTLCMYFRFCLRRHAIILWTQWRRVATKASSLQRHSLPDSLMRTSGCVPFWTTAGAKTWRVIRARGAVGEVCDAPLPNFETKYFSRLRSTKFIVFEFKFNSEHTVRVGKSSGL